MFSSLVDDYNTIFGYHLSSLPLMEDSSEDEDEEGPFMISVNASTRIVDIESSDSD